jgi:hypothetical protein
MKVLGGVSRLRYRLTGVLAGRNEEEACFETARSARGFSRRAGAVLDDKLAFSATLMRAGEVDAAFRMMREAEAEVRREETVLFDVVDHVAAAGATKRRRSARLRMARLLATTLVSALLLTLSVGGFALASAVVQRIADDEGKDRESTRAVEVDDGTSDLETYSVYLAGEKVNLDAERFRTYNKIKRGGHVTSARVLALVDRLPRDSVIALIQSLPPADALAILRSLPPDVAHELETIWAAAVTTDAVALVEETTKAKSDSEQSEPQQESQSEEPAENAPEAESSEPTETNTEGSESTKDSKKKHDGGSDSNETELNLENLLPNND